MIPASMSEENTLRTSATSTIILQQLYTDGSADYTLDDHDGLHLQGKLPWQGVRKIPNHWAEQRAFSSIDDLAAYAQALTEWHDIVTMAGMEYVFSDIMPQWYKSDIAQAIADMRQHLPALSSHEHYELIASLNTPQRLTEWVSTHPALRPAIDEHKTDGLIRGALRRVAQRQRADSSDC